jgi:acyl dehydratase
MTKEVSWEEFKQQVGKEVGISPWLEITQDRIDAFADCTEDRQWIHVDKTKARLGPMGTTVAHSFLILSLLPYFCLQYKIIPARIKMMVNYGLNRVRFTHPVPVGSKIRNRTVLKGVQDKPLGGHLVTLENTVEIEGRQKPALVAEFLALIYT